MALPLATVADVERWYKESSRVQQILEQRFQASSQSTRCGTSSATLIFVPARAATVNASTSLCPNMFSAFAMKPATLNCGRTGRWRLGFGLEDEHDDDEGDGYKGDLILADELPVVWNRYE